MPISKQQAVDAQEFHKGECLLSYGPRGGERRVQETWSRNGVTQTWKTRPDEFRVPVKYGLRGYGQLTHLEAENFHTAEDCPLEHTEYRDRMRNGYIAEVSKWGGGTLGRTYSGGEKWDVRVINPKGQVVLDDVISTGGPKTHKEVAGIAMEYAEIEEI